MKRLLAWTIFWILAVVPVFPQQVITARRRAATASNFITPVAGQEVSRCANDTGGTLLLPSSATSGNQLNYVILANSTLFIFIATSSGSATTAFTQETGSPAITAGSNLIGFQHYAVVSSGITGATYLAASGTFHCAFLWETKNANNGAADKFDATGATGSTSPWLDPSLTPTTGKSTMIVGAVAAVFGDTTCDAAYNDFNFHDSTGGIYFGRVCIKLVSSPSTSYAPTGTLPGGITWYGTDAAYIGTN